MQIVHHITNVVLNTVFASHTMHTSHSQAVRARDILRFVKFSSTLNVNYTVRSDMIF